MKRIRMRDLADLGASAEELEAYLLSDRLVICLEDDGTFTMHGAHERSGMTLDDLLYFLHSLPNLGDL